jgi:isocitrate dehydrogenase
MKKNIKITWTKVDEAPALASYSLLPIVKAFVKAAGVEVEESDISLAGRIIANFPDHLNEDQKRPDDLAKLGKLVMEPDANIIKLPNISASIPQLKEAIKELNEKGYNIPDYPEEPKTEEEKALVERFSKVLGSAVNPVLRQGNSDRRAANSVKKFAQKHPHKLMKPFNSDSKTHVSFMSKGDFYGNEQSITTDQDLPFKIILESDKETVVLKDGLSAEKGETLDGTFMSAKALRDFYDEQIKDAKEKEVLFSLHLKATMMKVSDPILFGHAVKVFYKDLFDKHGEELERIGFNPNNGIDDLYKKLDQLTEDEKSAILQTLKEIYASNPDLAMVDSDKGITNLHAPNLVIVDASMPVVVRDGGKMWGPDGQLHETKAVIPDRSYSRMYQAIIEDCKINGQFDPATMGSVSNVGLMAKKAEEYGSHPTTFEIPFDGMVKFVD